MRNDIVIIGGGLAGSEAAWQSANRGAKVTLYEMRPKEMTQAHKTGGLAELVCSNSLGSADLLNAPGILKEEMRRLDSLIIRVADEVRVPAGSALAVDREKFSFKITQALEGHPNIRILHEEMTEIPTDCLCILATGPLTSDKLSQAIAQLTRSLRLWMPIPSTWMSYFSRPVTIRGGMIISTVPWTSRPTTHSMMRCSRRRKSNQKNLKGRPILKVVSPSK
jgi:methylenetetrahydrofolate--tRNA-(uracil-5-)-methyltransferase